MTYIAGFVVKQTLTTLSCEMCLSDLLGDKVKFFAFPYYSKIKQGLIYLSSDVITLDKKSKQYLRIEEKKPNTVLKNNSNLLITI